MGIEELRSAVKRQRDSYSNEEKVVQECVNEVLSGLNSGYSECLEQFSVIDGFVKDIKKGKIKLYPEKEMSEHIIALTLIIHQLGTTYDRVSANSDISKHFYQKALDEAYAKAEGTIEDKKTQARKEAEVARLAHLIEENITKTLKNTIDRVENTQAALKKVLSFRSDVIKATLAGRGVNTNE